MKYQQKPSLGAILAEYILEQMTPDWLPKIDFVIPIPLHPAKQRDRGYNQAAAIARAIATKRQIPVKEEGLQRVKFTRTQTKLTREERRDNMIGAFQLQDGNTLENSAVLLVDDVFTTGSTMESAAHTLQSHGIIAVYGFTLAAAPLHDRS